MKIKIRALAFFSISLLLSGALIFIAGCTKSRSKSFLQTQGVDLDEIAQFDNAEFKLQTAESIGSPPSSKAEVSKVTVKKNQDSSDLFLLVKYQTEAKLLKDTPFVGRAHHQYKIVYKLTEKYLKVYKVGPENDIPVNERSYMEKFGDDLFGVPLIGYPITYYSLQTVENDIGERTSKIMEVQQRFKERATHFRLHFGGAQIFEPIEKIDVFPTQFFDGEWFFSETIIAVPDGKSSDLGLGANVDQNLDEANRIKFIKKESFLKAVNVNIDDRLKSEGIREDDINYASTLTIPATWKDYRSARDGNDKGLREEEFNEKSWESRGFVRLELEHTSTALLNQNQNIIDLKLPNKLVQLEISEEHFSFTVQKHQDNMRIRYSFMRVGQRSYLPKRHFEADSKKFGYYVMKKATVLNHEIRRKEDLERNHFITRFNPQQTEIRYFLTSSSPEWIRPIAQSAVDAWNWAFREAGASISIVLDTSRDVELGDLRYNAINLVESRTGGNLFGFGPTVSDPLTGEIVSATSNVHITPIRASIDEEISNYVRHKLGEAEGKYIPGVASMGLLANRVRIAENKNNGEIKIIQSEKSPFLSLDVFDLTQKERTKKKLIFEVDSKNKGREFDLAITSKNFHEDIERLCPEVLSYIAKIQKNYARTKKGYSEDQNAVQDDCSKKLVIEKALGTLVHEMGHNFGLRHNFMASTDRANFWPAKFTKTADVVRSSSVMEYPSFNEDRLIIPGKYDIEAIRYGYVDSIKLRNGKVDKIDVNKTIETNIGGQNLPKFKYCTDEDLDLNSDPMCRQHDAGVTPLEVVQYLISYFNSDYAMSNHRFDRPYSPSALGMGAYRLMTVLKPMRQIYDHWRMGLNRILGNQDPYLTHFNDPVEFEIFLEKSAAKNPEFAKFYQEYRPASKLVYAFFKRLSLLPNRYCLGTYPNHSIDIVDFELMRQPVFFSSASSVKSCLDPEMKRYGADVFKLNMIGDMGYFLRSIKFDLSPEKADEPNDVVGLVYERQFALGLISKRLNSSYYAQVNMDFEPSLLDEPQFRKDWIETVENRLTEGVQLSDFGDPQRIEKLTGKKLEDDGKGLYFSRFKSERDILLTLFSSMREGLSVPKNSDVSDQRDEDYEGGVTTDSQRVQTAYRNIKLGTGRHLVVKSKNARFTLALLDKLVEIDSSFEVEENDLIVFKEELKGLARTTLTGLNGKELMRHYLSCKNIIKGETVPDYKKYVAAKLCDIELRRAAGIEAQMKAQAITPEQYEEFAKKINVDQILGEEKKEIPFTTENFDKMYDEIQEDLLELATYSRRHRLEYEAQKNMILEILKDYPDY